MARASRRPSLLSPTRVLRRRALTKGLLGGSRGWLLVGGFLWGPRLMRRYLGRTPQHVASVRMDGGTGMQLRTFRPPSRSARRAARRVSQ